MWALQDINFEVNRGESMAIIGRNGSGKSTLLEIISQTLTPTTGSAQITGRVAALLELGSGFKPDYTGHENVYLNGLLLGLNRAQIEQRYDDILAFADIGDVLDRPVKTYSSGMLVRLAFAVQVALEPDILIVDEALSVGDYFFQQKCFGRLRKMRENGLTLLFVSHDMGSVRDLCSRAVYLQQGRLQFLGDSKFAIQRYLNETGPPRLQELVDGEVLPSKMAISDESTELQQRWLQQFRSQAIWQSQDLQRHIQAVRILGADGEPTSQVRMGDIAKVQVLFQTVPNEVGHIGLAVKNRFEQIVTNVGSYTLGLDSYTGGLDKYGLFEVELTMALEAGQYSMLASFGTITEVNIGTPIDPGSWFGPVEITWDYSEIRAPFLGMFGLPAQGRFSGVCEESQ